MSKVSIWALLVGAVAASVPAWGEPAPSFAASRGPAVLAQAAEEEENPAARDENKKLDPDDVRSVVGGIDLVRDMNKLTKPIPPGLWQKYVNQPYYSPETKAEKLLFHGQYEDAEKAFGALLAKAKPEDAAHFRIGQMSAILNQGRGHDIERFNKLYDALDPATKDLPRVVVLRARALLAEGKSDDAAKLLKSFYDTVKELKGADGHTLRAVNMHAENLERRANYPAAKVVYGKIAELEKDTHPNDGAIQTEVIFAVYRLGVLSMEKERKRYVLTRLASIFQVDSTYWPAYLLSGHILLDSHNEKESQERIGDTLSRNPNTLEAMYLSFDHMVEVYNFEAAEKILEEIRDRSDAPRVYGSAGRLLLKKRTPEKALVQLETAVKKDPNYPEARGWLAATYFILNEPEKCQAQLDALTLEGRLHPVVLFEAGEVLRDARQFPLAEKLYKQSRDLAPWWSEPSSALAQLYLETGHEDLARKEYEKSFAIDPSNIRALNQLRLLETYMKDFLVINSASVIDPAAAEKLPRVIIKCAPEDEVLARLAMDWMEKIYPEVTGYFQHTPSVPTIIEFFPNHDQFGVRTTGLPWIGTVGASTGNVIAMDVPRGQAKNMMGTFDWARVLRHEYTHTVTLSMTNNRIPHWLTEAAACEQELAPRDWDNCQMLAQNYRANTLFTLDTLTWGFIKPKRSIDRRLAYMQSQWVYQYLVETYGQPKMLAFIKSFGEGKTEFQAYKTIYGKTSEQLTKDFLVWAGKQIESWGLPAEPLGKKEDLEKKIKANPDDVKARFDLAWVLVNEPRGLPKAKEQLEAAQKIEPGNTKVRELLGAVLNNMGKKAEAKKVLTAVVEEDDKRVVAVRTLGLIAMADKDFDAAEKWFSKLQTLRPGEETSYQKLAGIYMSKKEPVKAAAQLAKLQQHEQKDETLPRQLSAIYMQTGQLAEAESSAFRAVRINPYNAVNHHQLALSLMAQSGKATDDAQKRALAAKAAAAWKTATDLHPKMPAFWNGLAEASGTAGDLAAASDAAKKAVALQPASPAKKWIKE